MAETMMFDNDTQKEVWDCADADWEQQNWDEKTPAEQPWLTKGPVEKRYEYLSVRFQLKGFGHTQELYLALLNEKIKAPWATLPEMLETLGENGWSLVTHTTHSDGLSINGNKVGGSAKQHMTFCRPLV